MAATVEAEVMPAQEAVETSASSSTTIDHPSSATVSENHSSTSPADATSSSSSTAAPVSDKPAPSTVTTPSDKQSVSSSTSSSSSASSNPSSIPFRSNKKPYHPVSTPTHINGTPTIPSKPLFQTYTGLVPFNSLTLLDWPPGRGMTVVRPLPNHEDKITLLQSCPQILQYIQSYSGADWLEATFTREQPSVRITVNCSVGNSAREILRLSDEMVLQWVHRYDAATPVWAIFVCPAMLSGLMVGKTATNLKHIESTTGARVWAAPRDPTAQYVSFFISSSSYEATQQAYQMMESRASNQIDSMSPHHQYRPQTTTSTHGYQQAPPHQASGVTPSSSNAAAATTTKAKEEEQDKKEGEAVAAAAAAGGDGTVTPPSNSSEEDVSTAGSASPVTQPVKSKKGGKKESPANQSPLPAKQQQDDQVRDEQQKAKQVGNGGIESVEEEQAQAQAQEENLANDEGNKKSSLKPSVSAADADVSIIKKVSTMSINSTEKGEESEETEEPVSPAGSSN